MKNLQNDIIAAIATPIGEGGISVIRVSGEGAIALTDQGFRGKASLCDVASHTVHYGNFVDSSDNIIDEVLISIFKSPNSYTAEDSAEISCHGGIFVTKKILTAVLSYGARSAEPGEFTKRAFLNGRIDLSQAEAVADIIQSRSETSHKTSLLQLQGHLSNTVHLYRNKLLDICSLLELELDFAEEGLEFTDLQSLGKTLASVIEEINELINSYDKGKLFREGIKVVLTGRPNVGKSSILNALLDENRAIVTHIPGTTRDIIEENITINGLLFKVVDTAGLRDGADIVEAEGIKRSEQEIKSSDVVVFIMDASEGMTSTDDKIIQGIFRLNKDIEKSIIFVFNKIDIADRKLLIAKYSKKLHEQPTLVSAKTSEGFDTLRNKLLEVSFHGSSISQDSSLMITNVRHRDLFVKARKSLILALESLKNNQSNELIALDMRTGLSYLGEITGEISTDDILNNIFSKFCIGK